MITCFCGSYGDFWTCLLYEDDKEYAWSWGCWDYLEQDQGKSIEQRHTQDLDECVCISKMFDGS